MFEKKEMQGWGETIQCHLRNMCLAYGAGLIYVTAQGKVPKNCDVLYEYLMHLMYNHSFRHTAMLDPKDSVFLPSGFDQLSAVKQAAAAIPGFSLDEPFEKIVKP